MSIKVYDAWRLNKGAFSLWEFISDIQPKLQVYARKQIKREIDSWKPLKKGKKVTDWEKENALRKCYAEQLVSSHGFGAYDFDLWLNFYEHRGAVYILLVAGNRMGGAIEILQEHPGLEKYGYWNNTDAPEDMDPREWTRRSKVWDEILDHTYRKLRLVIVEWEYNTWVHVSPVMEASKKAMRKER